MSTEKQDIRDLSATWHRATAAGDVETVLTLMADDVVFLVAAHPPMRGHRSFEEGLRALLRQHRLESTCEVQGIEVSGDLGYCWSTLTVRTIPIGGGHPTVLPATPCPSFDGKRGIVVVVRDANMLSVSSAPPSNA